MDQLKRHITYSFISKMTAIISQIVSLGVITKGFDSQDLTLWLLFFQITFFFSLFDFGIAGGGYQNQLAILHASNQKSDEKNFFVLSRFFQIGFLYLAGFIGLLIFFNTSAIFGISKYDPSYLRSVFFLFGFFSLIKTPFSLWSTTLVSLKQGDQKSKLEIIDNLVMVILALSLFFFKASFSQAIIICSIVSLFLASLFFSYTFKSQKWTFFIPKAFFVSSLTHFRQSLSFWIQNLLSLALFGSIPLIVNHKLTLESSGSFVLSYKICMLIIGIHLSFLSPQSPFYTVDAAHRNYQRAFTRLKKSTFYSFLFLTTTLSILALFFNSFAYFWTGREIDLDPFLLLWTLLYGIGNCFSIFLNALGKISGQILSLSIGLCFLFIYRFSLNGSFSLICLMAILPLFLSNIFQVTQLFYASKKSAYR